MVTSSVQLKDHLKFMHKKPTKLMPYKSHIGYVLFATFEFSHANTTRNLVKVYFLLNIRTVPQGPSTKVAATTEHKTIEKRTN